MGVDEEDRRPDADDPLEDVPQAALTALTDVRRRYVLYYLRDRDGADLTTLARVVSGWIGAESDAGLTTSADHDRLELELHHTHLPTLDDAGLLDYDAETNYASARSLPEPLSELLDRTSDLEAPAVERSSAAVDLPDEIPPFRAPGRVDSLRELVAAIERTATTITVFASEPHEELLDQFSTRNVEISHESLPAVADDGFVLVQQNGAALGSIGLDALREADRATVAPPWGDRGDSPAYRQFLSLFRETAFSTDSRRELLATTREIEDRAWRTGEGRLRAGFQSLSAYQSQLSVYRRLGSETDLDVHVYGRPDWTPPAVEGVRLHEEADDEDIGRVWFVVFRDTAAERDGAGRSAGGSDAAANRGSNSCALLAEERKPDRYFGFWTYDDEFVAEIDDYLAAAY
ncbi:DICT sensory domain-containing protein [Natronoarchaeum mannanilyticum]|uniref:Histidine kinase n=1 Tax=Natronoarchaeum mannanilyticum TaxID=926360 RepID=A0AAV3T6U5_9EURY